MRFPALVLGLTLSTAAAGCGARKGSDEARTPDAVEGTLSGRVVSASGQPVAGAKVAVLNRGLSDTTDEDGRFALAPELPDSLFFGAFDPEKRESALTQVWIEHPTANVRIQLGADGTGEVQFPGAPGLTAQVAFWEELSAFGGAYNAALAEAVDEPQNRVLAARAFERTYPRDARRKQLRARIDTEEDATLRRILTLYFFTQPSLARGFGDSPADPALAASLLDELQPGSKWWRIAPGAMWNAVTETGDVAAWEAYLGQALAHPADPFLPVAVLKDRMLDAWELGRIDEATQFADRLRALDGVAGTFAIAELSALEAAFGELRIGARMPAFEWTARGGEAISNETLAGHVYLLYFWAPWCGACKQDIPPLKRLQADQAKQLRIVSVALTDQKAFDAFARERGPLPWTHILVPEGDGAEAVHARFTSSRLPTWLLVDEDGSIVESSRNFPFSTPQQSALYEHVVEHLGRRDR